jgi:triosephosphate isomerase
VLYGGSVSGKNIADYIQYRQVDGALVGGASLNAAEFKQMVATAAKKN